MLSTSAVVVPLAHISRTCFDSDVYEPSDVNALPSPEAAAVGAFDLRESAHVHSSDTEASLKHSRI